ncbi:MAG: DNA translocase FtsK, partial [Bacteroidales bacterium]|nr:DNA translocase FtsK [Bacteroidales bacterium]
SYIPAELRQSDDIVMEVHRRPDEAPALYGQPMPQNRPVPPTEPAAPATIGAAMAAAATTPATVTTAGLGGASTIAIDDIPLATQTISGTLSESLRETAAPAPTETPASASTPTPTPTAIRLEDIPLEEPAPAEAAPQPEAAPDTPDNEIGFTVERPAEPETADAAAITPPATHIGLDTPYDPTLELRDYRFPTLDLLEDFGAQETQVQEEELLSNKNRIVETLQNYGIKIDTIKATIGPTVTLYEIVPAAGIRISKIKNLEDDIALSLSALGIRIIAPIPGKGTIGIEVPNQNKQIVPMRDMICCQKFQNDDYSLPIALGKTISNEAFVTDLAKMPHLLVAGATGQGKSVGLNAIIASLLYKKHPSELKFVMVDPKKVELSLFNKIERHYLAKLPDAEEAIITDTRKVVRTLNSLCIEMDTRYDLLKNAGAKNIKEYNKKFIARRLNPENGHRFLPYIVLIIDEFADLIMTAGKEIEMPIARLAQLARAIGIHLVIATQRPSVNIITGTIKANFPARIAFKVSSKTDSRTILDCSGADQLIGRGDMLLSTGNELVRIQCAYIDTPEIERITDYIGEQRAYPHAYELPDCPEEGQEGGRSDFSEGDRDSLFEEVARFVVSSQQGSTSSVQRKFKLGYNRAGRIIDQLEDAGIVGPLERNTREVRIKDPVALEQLLNADRSII